MQRRTLMMAGAGVLAAPLAAHGGSAPVVLELFTSQGCSSCPPADRLLGELARDASVVALAWHVDYWNGLGWADPFATKLATDRQRSYAERLGEDVYTPALVVGGTRMVVGSDRNAVRAAMAAAKAPAVPVTVVADGDGMALEVGEPGQPATALLALYEPEHVTNVGGGENGGRQLHEFRIVRSAMPLATWTGGSRRLPLPAIPAGLGAAVLLQATDLRVLGAATLRPLAA